MILTYRNENLRFENPKDLISSAVKLGEAAKKVTFYSSKFTVSELKPVFSSCRECEEIDLSYCDWFQDEDLEILAIFLKGAISIKKLSLKYLPLITTKGIEHFKTIPSLEEIDAQCCLKISVAPDSLQGIVKVGGWTGYQYV